MTDSTTTTTDYNPSPEIQKLWKEFGCDNSAGRLLRSVYHTGKAPMIYYPKVKQKSSTWMTTSAEPKKSCPQQAKVNYPKYGRRKSKQAEDAEASNGVGLILPRGKKSFVQIKEETNDFKPELEPGPRGQNRELLKERLQELHTYGGGKTLPKGAMGNNVGSSMPAAKSLRRINTINNVEQQEIPGDLSKEDSELFEEICQSINKKRDELTHHEKADIVSRPINAHQHKRERGFRENQCVRLKNEIESDMKDLRKILDLTKPKSK